MKVATYSGTRNLYPYMITAAKSLLLNSDVEKIYFLIEDDSIPNTELPDIIECINVSYQQYFPESCVNMDKYYFTYMAYMRAVLADLFPDLDKILALDVDTIIEEDISDIWDLPVDDYYFAAAREEVNCRDGFLYTNMGVTLYNLKKIREDKLVPDLVDMINTVKLICPEQEAFNILCRGHILEMSSDYNCTRYTLPTENPKVVHYAGIKQWFNQPEVGEYARLSLDEVLKYRKSKKFRKLKKRVGTTYMIHACPDRMWYVNDYLIPSMKKQGITDSQIIIWEDKEKLGNLESFMQSCKWIGEHENYLRGIWHLQDDIVISKRFRELTEVFNHGVAQGFCNVKCDASNVNMIGLVPPSFTWLSFPCIRIPNLYAKQCAEWFYEDVLPNGKYKDWVAEGKNDDAMWKHFMIEAHPNECCYNFLPNIVEHVDYLIGGSKANKQRDPNDIRTAYFFEEPEIVEELKKTVCC